MIVIVCNYIAKKLSLSVPAFLIMGRFGGSHKPDTNTAPQTGYNPGYKTRKTYECCHCGGRHFKNTVCSKAPGHNKTRKGDNKSWCGNCKRNHFHGNKCPKTGMDQLELSLVGRFLL